MNIYNPDIHHRKSIRLKGYDYSQPGLYFITICVQDRKHLFGKIENKEMILNEAGKIAEACWQEIPEHFPNVKLHEYIIMPNHVHGIVEIVGAENFLPQYSQTDTVSPVGAENILPQHSIGSIVKGFKIGVTKWFRNNKVGAIKILSSIWQRNYYEHIIRNEQSFEHITAYIINNPSNWADDDFSYFI
jgi:REP element-mobilizing transposase RayT